MFRKISIIGTGLIGGSLGLAFKQTAKNLKIIGFDSDIKAIEKAIELGAIDEGTNSIENAVHDSDVIFLCTPLDEIIKLLPLVSKFAKLGAIITDVGSVKKAVLESAKNIKGNVYFIGGHPMAGSEKKGVSYADPFLFQNAVYALCPSPDVPIKIINDLTSLIKLTGANVVLIDPEVHDKIAGYISHLPQLIAVLLVNTAGDLGVEYLTLAGGGFRDLTRIASSQFEIWGDIISLNREKLLEAIDAFIVGLNKYKLYLLSNEIEKFRDEFDRAFKLRNEIPLTAKGFIHKLYDVFVMVEDRPGVLSKISTALYEGGLNIRDIELLRVREGIGGTFRISFESEMDANKAIEIIKSLGYKVFTR
jgi:prephenate dehydrogenase